MAELKAALDQLLCAVTIISVVVVVIIIVEFCVTLDKFSDRIKDACQDEMDEIQHQTRRRRDHGGRRGKCRSIKELKLDSQRRNFMNTVVSKKRNLISRTKINATIETSEASTVVGDSGADVCASQGDLSSVTPTKRIAKAGHRIFIHFPEEDDERSEKVIKTRNCRQSSPMGISRDLEGLKTAGLPNPVSPNSLGSYINEDTVEDTQDDSSPVKSAESTDDTESALKFKGREQGMKESSTADSSIIESRSLSSETDISLSRFQQ
ncbi:unnamed protein product [Toxocara canis]|uniref:Uncharacterized protein n=1 Tax=Toxocara canis TaxID=6265 RepID=A0A183V6V1_TOXCA|nr:unnamed protein product [Toxocara canis]